MKDVQLCQIELVYFSLFTNINCVMILLEILSKFKFFYILLLK